jgi:hypothetical protein
MSAADVNKVFLQAVLSRKLISDDLIRVLFKKAVEAVNGLLIFRLTSSMFS